MFFERLNLAMNTGALRLQYGALPYRVTSAGELEVLLITSRRTRRWIIPKGWPMKGMKPAKVAAREAYEEAGVRGTVSIKPIGTFVYEKFLDEQRDTVSCSVRVFPLLVRRQRKTWPESHQRESRWCASDEVGHLLDNEGLRKLIELFAVHRRPDQR